MTRALEAACVAAIAALITLVIAGAVVRDPSGRVFGMPSVGHHHDPFTVMQQFERPRRDSTYFQPATDVPGALLTRAVGPIAAYNWIVLLTFPLSAATAYLLARHLALERRWAAMAGLAFAFSPFHLAHAAYHPHVAQTQWLPLYLLALWRSLDRPGRGPILFLAAAAFAVTLSNAYGGLIAALITPPAVIGYWYAVARHRPHAGERLATTRAALAVIFAAAAIHAVFQIGSGSVAAAPLDDLSRYGARWWSYAVPPVAHPLAGAPVRRLWHDNGVDVGLVEQQVSLGIGVVLLGAAALLPWLRRARRKPFEPVVGVIALVAAAAFVLSLAPGASGLAPSSALHWMLPMFRSFARFGMVVQLMAVLLAALGAQRLWQKGTAPARRICIALVGLVAAEYAVAPSAMSRPVLPTAAHERVARLPAGTIALDCTPSGREAGAILWLTSGRVTQYRDGLSDCLEPNFADKLAADGFSHVIVRRASREGQWLQSRPRPEGWERVVRHADSDLYAITSPAPDVHTVSMSRFYPREHDQTWTWRWMGKDASWWIANNTAASLVVTIDLEIMAVRGGSVLTVLLDGRVVQAAIVSDERGVRRIGPMRLTPGGHELAFRSGTVAIEDAPERRPLSFRIGGWRWLVDHTRR